MGDGSDQLSARVGFAGWYTLAVLWLLNALSTVDRVLPYLLLEPIRADIPLTDTEIGTLGGVVFSLTYSVAALPLAWLADRTSRKVVGALGALLWSAMTALNGAVTSFYPVGRLACGCRGG